MSVLADRYRLGEALLADARRQLDAWVESGEGPMPDSAAAAALAESEYHHSTPDE